ncbi:MAG: hypothetical protein ACXVB9_05815 [Bdellovibrionota bacterium]
MKFLIPLLLLTACAATPPPPKDPLRGRWPIECRDLKVPPETQPFLLFTMQEKNRIADLHFQPGLRYEGYAIPDAKALYGPFKGEEITTSDSTYRGANDYKIAEDFHLFLPYLKPGFENAGLGRDRDSPSQNAAIEVAVAGQRYASIIHLHCERP